MLLKPTQGESIQVGAMVVQVGFGQFKGVAGYHRWRHAWPLASMRPYTSHTVLRHAWSLAPRPLHAPIQSLGVATTGGSHASIGVAHETPDGPLESVRVACREPFAPSHLVKHTIQKFILPQHVHVVQNPLMGLHAKEGWHVVYAKLSNDVVYIGFVVRGPRLCANEFLQPGILFDYVGIVQEPFGLRGKPANGWLSGIVFLVGNIAQDLGRRRARRRGIIIGRTVWRPHWRSVHGEQ